MGREYELKYSCSPEQLAALREEYGSFSAIRMETVYYDAADGSLGRQKWTLRRRQENDRSVCTLKTRLPDGSRGEWEVDCGDILSGIPALIAAGAPEALAGLMRSGPVPVCGARFLRLARRLQVPGGEVELALDSGVLLGGGREEAFAEVEVELKSGPDSAADAFAAELACRHALTLQPLSKFQRALLLG